MPKINIVAALDLGYLWEPEGILIIQTTGVKIDQKIASGKLTFVALKLQEIIAFADKSTLLSKQNQKG